MNARPPLTTHDTTRIDDTRIRAVRPLLTPALLEERLPAPDAAQQLVEASRAAISRVLHGRDDRLVGYTGGLEKKRWLLAHEGAPGFLVP